MKKKPYEKVKIINIAFILILFFYLIFTSLAAYSQDAKTQFIEAIKKQQSLMPKSFNCKISSSLFLDFFKQLIGETIAKKNVVSKITEPFTKTINDLSIYLFVENGKTTIKIEGIKQDYLDFALSYFSIYTELLSYVFLSQEELSKTIENYEIKIDKNTFTLKDFSDLTSYSFIFSNNLLTTVIFYQQEIKMMEINITYFTYKNYQLVKQINIINYDDNGNKKDNSTINFSNYKF